MSENKEIETRGNSLEVEDWLIDEEGLYCPKCGLSPHFCQCKKSYETMGKICVIENGKD